MSIVIKKEFMNKSLLLTGRNRFAINVGNKFETLLG